MTKKIPPMMTKKIPPRKTRRIPRGIRDDGKDFWWQHNPANPEPKEADQQRPKKVSGDK